jgi:hypothetical protein
MSQAGGTPLGVVAPSYSYAVNADSAYGVESLGFGTGLILDQVPKAGGTWQRKRALGSGDGASALLLIGERYVFAANPAFPPGGNTIGGVATKPSLRRAYFPAPQLRCG